MTRSDRLRAEADRRKATFFNAASTLSGQMRPANLLNDALGALDPNFERLQRLEAEVKRNPIALLAALGSLWFLTQQLTKKEPPPRSAIRQGMRPHRLPPTTQKGEENGYNNDPKQHGKHEGQQV